jgi:hypothetical protein
MTTTPAVSAAPPVCGPQKAGAPMFITADCIDPILKEGVIDVDEWRDTPVRHRYVNGHFAGTGSRFSMKESMPSLKSSVWKQMRCASVSKSN